MKKTPLETLVATLLYIPIVLSLAVIGAHFMRYGHQPGVAVASLLIALLFVRRPWVARIVQVALVLAAIEWVRTLYLLAAMRAATGESATRMVIILASVATVTLLSALLFESKALKRIYGHGKPA